MVGAGVGGQVEAAAEGAAFGIAGREHHPTHTGLDQGTGAHRAGFEGHQQAAVVEAPVAPQGRRLAQRHQFGVTERILLAMPAVAAPAQAMAMAIEDHSRHRDFSLQSHPFRLAQQALHPEFVPLALLHRSLVAVGALARGRMPPHRPAPLASAPSVQRLPHSPVLADAAELHGFAELKGFADPAGLDPQLERFLHQASSLLCQWLGQAEAGSPLPALSVLPAVEPEAQGLPAERLLADLQLVMEGAFNPNHPGALAHLDPPPLAASIAADLICAGLNNNLLAEELSPSLTRLERSLCCWLAQQLGLGDQAGGVAASGGSLSNLMALVTARRSRGLGCRADAVVLCSVDAHVSLDKAMTVMGLPAHALQRLPVDGQGRLEAAALGERLDQLAAAGIPVLAVVATAGTTVRGAIDPLDAIAAHCRRHGHWLHVDGAIGAVFALAASQRQHLVGLELADSVTVNPQKLLGITKTSSLLLLAQPAQLQAAFATGLPYMEPSWGAGHGGESGLQGSRPAEILKLWLGLRQLGLNGITALVEGAIRRRRQLEILLAAEPRLQLLGGPLHLLAFRPRGLKAEAADAWSSHTRQALLAQHLMLSRPCYHGHHHLKAVLGNPHTQASHLERLAQIVQANLPEAGDPAGLPRST